MRKNILAVSIAAMIGGLGFAGAASAGTVITDGATATTLEVSPTGVGHILLVPYFSTQNGNVSLLNIVNTDTVNGKAVKLRFRGAANSDDIYDITVFLSPGDMWSANVSQVDGVSKLTTNDNSCTLPAEKAAINVPFGTSRLGVAGSDNKAGTLEGYVEILNMADVAPNTALFTAIKHVNGTAPCATMASQKTNLVDAAAATARGYANPTGGLMANWSIINLSKAGSFTGEATAVVAIDGTGTSAPANIVFSPQEEDETVTNAADLTADPLLVGAPSILTPKNYDFPDLSTPYVADAVAPIDQAHILSNALATASVTNEYMTSPDVGFATDWTFSMPSRRYNVALDYTKTGDAARVFNPAAQYFTTANTKVVDGKICVNSAFEDLAYFNTEEGAKNLTVGGYVVSPKPVNAPAVLAFCGETSVLAFNKTFADATVPTGVLGALIARQGLTTTKADTTSEFYTDGWMSLKTPGNAGLGLPVVGHAFVKALASSFSLGGIWKHRTDATVAAPIVPATAP